MAGVGGVYMQECKAMGLTKQDKCGKIGADGEAMRQIPCPACGNERFLRVPLDARAYRIPVYCKRCRRFVETNID